MSYRFINIKTLEVYDCDEDLWREAYSFACEDGWVPDGTVFDFIYEINENCEDADDYNYDETTNLFKILLSLNEMHKWDGSYFEKRNQVMTGTDAYYMVLSLKDGDFPDALMDFMNKGSFRISSE